MHFHIHSWAIIIGQRALSVQKKDPFWDMRMAVFVIRNKLLACVLRLFRWQQLGILVYCISFQVTLLCSPGSCSMKSEDNDFPAKLSRFHHSDSTKLFHWGVLFVFVTCWLLHGLFAGDRKCFSGRDQLTRPLRLLGYTGWLSRLGCAWVICRDDFNGCKCDDFKWGWALRYLLFFLAEIVFKGKILRFSNFEEGNDPDLVRMCRTTSLHDDMRLLSDHFLWSLTMLFNVLMMVSRKFCLLSRILNLNPSLHRFWKKASSETTICDSPFQHSSASYLRIWR